MAKNREPVKPVEPESDSGEEEDATSEEEESDSDPEPILAARKPSVSTPAAVKKPIAQPAPKAQQKPVSTDEEESGSESDSDSDDEAPKVKPLASKPMDEPEKPKDVAKKPRSKSVNSEIVTPVKSTAGKRPVEENETDGKDAKKAKKKLEPEGSEKKSNLFQRLWSEDDEIEILKGMIEYSSQKKSDPVADMTAFHDYIKKNLHVDFTRTQLQDKIRRLKKKYMNNKGKEKEGKEKTFSNPHEQRAYDLSKKVWGTDNVKENGGEKVVGSPKVNGSTSRRAAMKRANAVESEVKDVKSAEVANVEKEKLLAAPTKVDYYGPTVEGRIERIGMELFETGKGLEGEKEWQRLKMEEMDAYQKLVEVRAAQSKLVIDSLRSAGH